LIRKSSG